MNSAYYLVIPVKPNGDWAEASEWVIVNNDGLADTDNAIVAPVVSEREAQRAINYHKRYGTNWMQLGGRKQDPLPRILARVWA